MQYTADVDWREPKRMSAGDTILLVEAVSRRRYDAW
jgi:hypothetical protein